jgi:hypothetical protein
MLSPDLFARTRTTPLTPQQLASRVARESDGISIKIGQVNGKPVLHLIRRRNEDKGILPESRDMEATETAWNLHPWNKANQPKAKKEARNT